MFRHASCPLLAAVLATSLLVAAHPVAADPQLTWTRPHAVIPVGEQTSVSVMLPTNETVRTIELTVQYDPAVVSSIDIVPGDLFAGFTTFTDFYATGPDTWTGYCVILGANDWATGPGELVRWTVAAVDTGTTPIITMGLTLLPPGGGDYPDALLSPAQILVAVPTGLPIAGPMLPTLSLYPNPFNPRTRVELLLPGGGDARLEVLDLRGRVVATPWRGTALADQPVLVDWTGQDRAGQPLPSGVYTFRLTGATGATAWRRGTLIR